jgi:hypothetical protein
MRRREFITLIAGAAIEGRTFAARAQQPSKMKPVATMHPAMKPTDMRSGGDPAYTIIFEEAPWLCRGSQPDRRPILCRRAI